MVRRTAVLAALMALAGCSGDVETMGVTWNDRFGDGEDRWRTGGISRSVVAGDLEVNARAEVVDLKEYAAVGVYRRGDEGRLGVEVGWEGDPLPILEAREAIHDLAGTDGPRAEGGDSRPHVNLEGRRTWRGGPVEPYVQASLGTREASVRVGADLLVGATDRTRTTDLSTGAVVMGEGEEGLVLFVGGDVGYVAHDALFREGWSARARVGAFLDLGDVGLGFSLNWLREGGPSQVVGAVQAEWRF